ncbi:hypothetical protein [Shimazuella alba]|uniref:Uncharacterized protein n=1 Tax=Shimazuella alba TaxID=2690964 RepID=A0A6I4W2R3_9BACL|nr:hypothetical protein [Shimazuella alba]MXQ55074.1 hypothetical protein [Shimazuella alba]
MGKLTEVVEGVPEGACLLYDALVNSTEPPSNVQQLIDDLAKALREVMVSKLDFSIFVESPVRPANNQKKLKQAARQLEKEMQNFFQVHEQYGKNSREVSVAVGKSVRALKNFEHELGAALGAGVAITLHVE